MVRDRDQPALQRVERVAQPLQVCLADLGREVDVLRLVGAAVRLDRRAADQNERDPVPDEHGVQRIAIRIDRLVYVAAGC